MSKKFLTGILAGVVLMGSIISLSTNLSDRNFSTNSLSQPKPVETTTLLTERQTLTVPAYQTETVNGLIEVGFIIDTMDPSDPTDDKVIKKYINKLIEVGF
ncbi:MAG: hypothetical protein ACD_65C00231G0004 [uncultured bacterium]|nr:MAG: hypothetical protein ACD_65C00231G0004 [uncultured bacterium]